MKGIQEKYSHLAGRLAEKTATGIHTALDAEIIAQLGDRFARDAAISGTAHSLAGYLSRWQKHATVTSLGLAVGGFILLGLAGNSRQPLLRITLAHSAVGCWIGAKIQRKNSEEMLPITGLVARLQAARSAMELSRLWDSPPVSAGTIYPPALTDYAQNESSSTVNLFNWEELKTKPDDFAHLMICGKTGSGKSLLAEWLLSLLGGELIAISPHLRPQDFQGARHIGGGRNYDAIAEEFSRIYEEMNSRYEYYNMGRDDFEPINIVCDEMPAIMANCEEVPEQFKALIREARKVRIRLIVLSQGTEVKALKLEGEGSVRDSLSFIRLGNFATQYAKKLGDESLTNWIKAQKRPCLVDEFPAIVPDLSHLK